MTGVQAGLPWHDAGEPRSAFPGGFLDRSAATVARELLGVRVRSTVDGAPVTGVIVETEAYLGPEDPASHAAARQGVTTRNRAMFGPAGRAYVYRSYGIHWCLNVVTGPRGQGQAVLIRGLEPLEGVGVMDTRRAGRRPLAAGPGRVGQALGIGPDLYGHDLRHPPLELLPGWTVPDALVRVTGRVGVRKAPEWPLRFLVADSPGVSRARCLAGDPSTLPDPLR